MDNFFEQFRKNKFYFFLLFPSLLFITVFVIYPIFYNINLSLRDVTVSTLLSPEWEFIGLDNYLSLIQNKIFMEVLSNSIAFTVGSITFQFIIGFALAMFLFKTFPGNKFIRTSIIMGWVLSPVVVLSFHLIAFLIYFSTPKPSLFAY
jgi:multiple sugar transport system permease protein